MLIAGVLALLPMATGIIGYRTSGPVRDVLITSPGRVNHWAAGPVDRLDIGPLILALAVLQVVWLAPYLAWHRGGSFDRVAFTLALSLAPYGFVIGLLIALASLDRVALAYVVSLVPASIAAGVVLALATGSVPGRS